MSKKMKHRMGKIGDVVMVMVTGTIEEGNAKLIRRIRPRSPLEYNESGTKHKERWIVVFEELFNPGEFKIGREERTVIIEH